MGLGRVRRADEKAENCRETGDTETPDQAAATRASSESLLLKPFCYNIN